MKIVWSPRAVGHLVALRDYIARDSDREAAAVAARLVEAVELLETKPHLGRPGRVMGTRELVVEGTPYVIPYRVRGDKLQLLAVFHGRRKWPLRW